MRGLSIGKSNYEINIDIPRNRDSDEYQEANH